MSQTVATLGLRKAAIVLIQLGRERAAAVLNKLSEAEVEAVSAEIARLDSIGSEENAVVLGEFRDLLTARSHIAQGGLAYARQLLEQSLGTDRASEIIDRLNAAAVQMPFQFLRRADPAQLRSFISDEHPQVIALVLAHMSAEKASLLLSGLPSEQQAEIAHRIAVMDRTTPDTIKAVESTLERKLSSMLQPADMSRVGGLDPLVNIINRSDRSTERQIVEGLESLDAALAEEVRARMFMFEDIVQLDDRSVQLVHARHRHRQPGARAQGCLGDRPRQDHLEPLRACRRRPHRRDRDPRPGPPHPGRGGPAGHHPLDPRARGAGPDHAAQGERR